MKKLSILVFAILASFALQGQITTPQPSPSSKIWQKVGLTDVTLEYSRPSMKDRTIFGGLVPYDMVWRTGANARTKITFSEDVTIGGKKLAAGTYAIFTKPSTANWEVYFYTETEGGGTPQEWDESKVALKTTAQVIPMPTPIETFTMTFDDLHNNGATLGMLWEKVYVGVPFEVPTVDMAVKSIESVMAGPNANDYYAAASYYYQEEKDMTKAKEWIDKAVSMNDKAYWMMRQKALIYAKTGDKKGAIAAAKKSMEVAQAEGNEDYVRMNKESLKEWGAM